MIKRIPAIIAMALCLIVIGACTSALRPGEAGAAPVTAAQTPDFISVTGTASIDVKPDTATFTTGVTTEHKDAKVAVADNAKTMDAIIAALKKAGVKDTDIKTSSYSVDPTYNYDGNKTPEIIGYRVTNMVQVTTSSPDKVGDILDAATGAGANQASSVQFSVKNPDAQYQQALTKAMENAKTSATTLAKAAGRNLNIVVQVTEGATAQPYSVNRSYASGTGYAMDAAATYIASGSTTVNATVSVVYSLK